jgi:hypothetical protein
MSEATVTSAAQATKCSSDILPAAMAQATEVDVKQAVANAQAYLLELFPITTGTLQLEEVEPDAGGWRITFSYLRQDNDPYGFGRMIAIQQGSVPRVYKVVMVDPSGEPKSVKIR